MASTLPGGGRRATSATRPPGYAAPVIAPPRLHDLACAVHVHSTHSDGAGTVPEIAAAGARAGCDVVLLTDHDTLAARRRGEERRYGSVLVLVGEEVSPRRRDHYLAFGIEEEIRHAGLSAAEICQAVADAGGFGFAAHPWSTGNPRFPRYGDGMPWHDFDAPALHGVELWSFLTDGAERLAGYVDLLRFLARPARHVGDPPPRNVAAWDRLCASRPVVAIAGLDAHPIVVPLPGPGPARLTLMGYARAFRQLRTHVLCERPPAGDLDADRDGVLGALRAGRCYLAVDALAPTRGFAFWAEGDRGEVLPMGAEEAAGRWTVHAALPRVAELRLVRDGREVARTVGDALAHRAEGPGVYRLEARLDALGARRTWIVSNPVYLR